LRDRLIARLNPKTGVKLLDVGSGTGMLALAAAQAIGEKGRVTAIDLAAAMLDRLQVKIDKFAIPNIDLHVMDAAALEFRRDYFDYVVCSYGLFLVPEMPRALKEWARVSKLGGTLLFTSCGSQAFQPMLELFVKRLENYAAQFNHASLASLRLADPQQCGELLSNAGLGDVQVTTEQLGYHLKDENQWWDVLRYSGLWQEIENIPRLRARSISPEAFSGSPGFGGRKRFMAECGNAFCERYKNSKLKFLIAKARIFFYRKIFLLGFVTWGQCSCKLKQTAIIPQSLLH